MKRRWSRIFSLSLAIPLLLGILAACGSGTQGNQPAGATASTKGSTTIEIGSDFPTSGKDESSGKPSENGAALAVQIANEKNLVPGYKFTFVPKDDVGPSGAHDAATGQKNVQDLIGDALVAGIVGPLNSSVAISELGVTNQAPIALISPANTNDCLTQTTPANLCGGSNDKLSTYRPTGKVTYFRIATLDQHQGGILADFAYQQKGYRKAYVVDDTETYGAGIANAFETQWKADGGVELGHDSLAPTTTSYINLLTKIASTKPDVIFFGGNDSTGGIAIRQQMEQIPALKNTPMLAGDGTQTSAFARTIGHVGGPVFTSVASVNAEALSTSKDFFTAYDAKYGQNNIGSYSAGSYDCAMIIINAIKAALAQGVSTPKDSSDASGAQTFRQAVIDQIQKIDYNGVTGHHTFDKNGDTTNKVISIYTIGKDVNQGDGWDFLTQLSVK
ncbi:MAG TPA: branched-chain amino acid ABC transporter substrate-binding protein [Ktedonobacteraceae bacterium]|jgi:branched-chain amino acid transport system substrate-binding protein|nr:branched-chain amino acid ABC transporter substrate-binding protein [Ktedonobacteraceae bacterium]